MTLFRSSSAIAALVVAAGVVTGCGHVESAAEAKSTGTRQLFPDDQWRHRVGETRFTVTMSNVSPPDAMRGPDGTPHAAGMSHGIFAIHRSASPIVTPGTTIDAATGIGALAEDGNVRPPQLYLWRHPDVLEGGIFYKPVGAERDEELWPGKTYEFVVTADPGDRLSLATMLMQSNDALYATGERGIALFDGGGTPISGDVTDQLLLWDMGTERNQVCGFGPDAGMFQAYQGDGPREREPVRLIEEADVGCVYPAAPAVLSVIVRPG